MKSSLKEGAKLKAIWFPDDSEYTVGKNVEDITVVMEKGQMAEVPWLLVKVNETTTVQINAANVTGVTLIGK